MPEERYSIELVADSGGPRSPSPWKLPARWKIEVRGKSKPNLRFNAAIVDDGHLELVEGIAPYDKEFTASRVMVLFEPTREGRLSVVAYSDVSGIYTRHAAHESYAGGRILLDETLTSYQAGSLKVRRTTRHVVARFNNEI
jgi:hypothetical protein